MEKRDINKPQQKYKIGHNSWKLKIPLYLSYPLKKIFKSINKRI